MKAPELNFVPSLKPLKPLFCILKIGTQVGGQAAARLCEKGLGMRLNELAVESNAAFDFVNDSFEHPLINLGAMQARLHFNNELMFDNNSLTLRSFLIIQLIMDCFEALSRRSSFFVYIKRVICVTFSPAA